MGNIKRSFANSLFFCGVGVVSLFGAELFTCKVTDAQMVAPAMETTAKELTAPVQVQTMHQSLNYKLSVPVLMYHDVTYLPHNSLGMSGAQFASEMAWLDKHQYHPISLAELYGAMVHGHQLPSKPIVITFDDGYESVYQNAFPVLKKYHFPATVFMITSAVGHRGKFPMLTWSELSDMETSQLIDVESHTSHHIDLAHASLKQTQTELQSSALTLQNHLHHQVLYFCYPSSKYSQQTIRCLQQDGYLLAFTERPGYANVKQGPYELHRIRVWEDMPISEFQRLLSPSTETRN